MPPLLGRDTVVADLVGEVRAGSRLVSVTGIRSVGTSRVAHAVVAGLTGAVHAVQVDGAVHRAEYVVRCGRALDLDETTEAGVLAALRVEPTVLLLDDCRAVEPVRGLVADLLEAVPDLVVVVTGAEPLGLPGEVTARLRPLDVPLPGEDDPAVLAASPAVALFRAAAAEVAPATVLDDLVTVAEVCRRLDGLPAALVVAASRLVLMHPTALLAEMSRLGAWELIGMSLETEIARSVGLLDDDTRRVLLALATTRDGCTVDALAAVAQVPSSAAVADALVRLVGLQLVVADPSRARYRPTSGVQDFARRRLADDREQPARRDRHAAFYAAAASAYNRQGHVAQVDQEWLLDHANRVAAVVRLRERGDRTGALALMVDSMVGFEHRGESVDARRLLDEVLGDVPVTPSGAVIRAHTWLGRLEAEYAEEGRTGAARRHLETALRLARERGHPLIHLEVLNAVCENHTYLEGGVALCEAAVAEGLSLCSEPGWELGRSVFLCWHAGNLHRRGELRDADAAITEAIHLARSLADPRLLMSFGIIHWQLPRGIRHDDRGVPSLERLVEMAEEQGHVRTRAWIHLCAIGVYAEEGDLTRAIDLCLTMARLGRETDHRPTGRLALFHAVGLLQPGVDDATVAAAAGVLAPFAEMVGAALPPRWLAHHRELVGQAAARLGDAAFRAEGLRSASRPLWDVVSDVERRLEQTRRELLVRPVVAPAGSGQNGTATRGAASLHGLTDREQQVLAALAEGLANKEIARQLGMRPKTVAHHCAVIYAKLGVRNRTEAAAESLRASRVDAR